jgi:hypothetical protein
MKQGITLLLNWFVAVLFSTIGIVNCVVGNDPEFGVFILLLSLLFYPPLRLVFQQKTGRKIPALVLILLGLFVFWSSLGVGELLNKFNFLLRYSHK